MDDGEDAKGLGRGEWGPPLGEDVHAAGVGELLGAELWATAGVEVGRGEVAKGARLIGVANWVRHYQLRNRRI